MPSGRVRVTAAVAIARIFQAISSPQGQEHRAHRRHRRHHHGHRSGAGRPGGAAAHVPDLFRMMRWMAANVAVTQKPAGNLKLAMGVDPS
jgi:hypothetical protein